MNCKPFGESQNPGHRARRSGCLGCGCRDERELYPDLGIRLLFHPVIMERAGDRSGQVKGRSPRSAEGEEARLCGGLWTPQGAVSNHTHSPRKYVIADPSFCGLRLLVCLAPTRSLSRTRVFYPRSDGAGKCCDEFSRADNRAGQTMALKPWPRPGCTIPWPRADVAGQWWRTADRWQPSTEHQRALKTFYVRCPWHNLLLSLDL